MATSILRASTVARAGVPRAFVPARLALTQAKRVALKPAQAESYKFQVTESGDLSALGASLLFLAASQDIITVGPQLVTKALAVAAFALPTANILLRKTHYNWAASSLAPFALAASALEVMALLPAALVAFGTDACNKLASRFDVDGAYYILLATLAAAIYYNYGAIWFCAAFVANSGTHFVKGLQDKSVYLSSGALAVIGGFAIFDFFGNKSSELAGTVAMCIILSQLAWSIFCVGQRFVDDLQSK